MAERSANSWSTLSVDARTQLLAASPATRVSFIKRITALNDADSVTDQEVSEIINILFALYPRHGDHETRTAIHNSLYSFIKGSHGLVALKTYAKHISEFAALKRSCALSDLQTVFESVNGVIVFGLSRADLDTEIIKSIALSQAYLLYKIITFENIEKHSRKYFSSINASSTTWARAFAGRNKNSALLVESVLSTLLEKPAVVADYVIRFPTIAAVAHASVSSICGNPEIRAIVDTKKESILKAYIQGVLSSKTSLSRFLTDSFGFYFNDFVSQEDVDTTLAPAVANSIRRAPEIILSTISISLFSNLPFIIDAADCLNNTLLTPILAAFGSSKVPVRQYASENLSVLLKLCQPTEKLEKVITSIITPLNTNKVSSADQRVFYGLSLQSITPFMGSAKIIYTGLVKTLGKEINEASLKSLTAAFFKNLYFDLQSNGSIDKTTNEAIVKGITEKRGNLKKIWITTLVSETLKISSCSSELESFLAGVSKPLIDSWKEINNNTSLAVQNNVVSIGFAIVALIKKLEDVDPALLAPFSEAKVIQKSLKNEKPSFLTSYRVFTKLTDESDIEWAVRALAVSTKELVSLNDETVSNDWALAWIYYLVASKSYKAKLSAFSLLKDIDSEYQHFIRSLFITNIETLLNRPKEDPKSTDDQNLAYVPFVNFGSIIFSLFTSKNKDESSFTAEDFVPLLIIAHHPDSSVKDGWISLCLEASVDPGKVVEKYSSKMLEHIFAVAETSVRAENTKMLQAAFSSAATLAFINGELIAPELVKYFVKNFDCSQFSNIDEETLAIWNTPEGVLAYDPVAKGQKYTENKNTKDFSTKQWEENVRKEIAAKKGIAQKQKYTKEEQHKIDEQLAKESSIRTDLKNFYYSTRKALALVSSLSKFAVTADNGIDIWFPDAVKCLLSLLTSGSTVKLFKGEPSRVYINLASNLSGEIAKNTKVITASGVACLRVLKVQEIESSILLDPKALGAHVTEFLYSLKFLRSKISANALIYYLPIIICTLESKNGIEAADEDTAEEQIIVALDDIATHADGFKDDRVPRKSLIDTLLKRLYSDPTHSKNIKDSLNSLLQSIADSLTNEELDLLVKDAVSAEISVRSTVLEIIDNELDLSHLDYSNEIWIERFESESRNAEMADSIWTENELAIDETSAFKLINFLDTPHSFLRTATSKAITAAIQEYPELLSNFFDELVAVFKEKSKPPVSVKDKYGMEVNPGVKGDTWEIRSGIALTLKELAPILTVELTDKVFHFLIDDEALGDQNSKVRQEVQDAGRAVIQYHGLNIVETLIPIFDMYLAKDIKKSEIHDRIRESVVILYGALACHLKSSDPRVISVVDKLIGTLDTPNENVQYAASECLAPLVKLFQPKLGDYFQILQDKLFSERKFAERRGAAYGIAGLVKGAGIVALADYDLTRILIDAVEDRKDFKKRQGAQFAFECLSQSLKAYFEPYAFEIIPLILSSLGDNSPEVREATSYAAREIMRHSTGYGIKKLVPLALESLDQTAWRAKKGAVELLGIMAYLDPRQLSTSLSTIIPELVGVLNDSHREVRNSANQSLKKFGDVIKNPEIQSLVPVLIKAISDPTQHTEEALDGLLKTRFVHYIDAPSLALVIHILHRGLKDRSANIKRKAAQIVGNMAILTDSNDLIPYLPILISELETSMVDPVPATRSTASRSIGALVEKLGEDQFPDLIPRLMSTLKAKDRVGDRLGSAQGLAEIIYGLGIHKLEELLPIILKNCTASQSHVREGFMPLLIYLPGAFSSSFSPYLSQIIPPILSGLADDVEGVRETSIKAGRLVITNFAAKAVDLLLPELERGLSDYSYRIRTASVELTGDLLYQLTGVSGNAELGEEDRIIVGDVSKNIVEALGTQRRDNIFSAIFICRTDTYVQVRSVALDVWKSLVFNTPRMIKEILPTLTMIIINRLASTNQEQRTIAALSLGELVRRVGGTALSRLLPTLNEGMKSSDVDARQGICIAITELIGSTQVDDLETHQALFINIIREGLGDFDEKVRTAAAKAFDALQTAIGNQILDKILPDLIKMLQNEETSENALAALQNIISTKAAVVFPVLMPTLLSPPMTVSNARSLGALASVAGHTIIKRFSYIVNALVDALVETKKEEDKEVFSNSLDSVLLSINFDDGVHVFMQHMLSLGRNAEPERREITFDHMSRFFENTHMDYSEYTQDWIGLCVTSLDDVDPKVVESAWKCLTVIIKVHSKSELEGFVKSTRQTLRTTGMPGQELPGFALPKGPSCVLPIFLQGLMYGTNDQREASAFGIADVVERTSAANLKPFVTQITGPLIRTVGERFPPPVKAAILYSLNVLLNKIPTFLKPFLPQLQRTFAKALADPTNETLRTRAAKALGTLIKFQPKVDPLITDLVTGAHNTNDEAVIASMLKALSDIVVIAGSKMGASSKTLVSDFVEDQLDNAPESKKKALAKLVGGIANSMDSEEAGNFIASKVLNNPNVNFAVLSLNALLRVAGTKISESGATDEVAEYIIAHINSSDDEVSEGSIRAAGKYILETYALDLNNDTADQPKALNFNYSPEIMSQIVQELATAMGKSVSRSVETRRLALVVVRTVARHKYDLLCTEKNLDILVPAIFGCVRDSVIPVKLAAEKAYLQVLRLTDDLLESVDLGADAPEGTATKTFDVWYKHAVDAGVLAGTVPRSLSEFTRRVGSKLAAAEVDRIQAGGDDRAVYSDRIEDEEDVWAIGNVELEIEEDV